MNCSYCWSCSWGVSGLMSWGEKHHFNSHKSSARGSRYLGVWNYATMLLLLPKAFLGW